MAIADEFSAYQTYLEGARAYPDDEQIAADLERARRAMQIAWLDEIGLTTTEDGDW